ncbi:MAG: hypothetical protein AABX52_02440 [Nanoarchaeota archaeon]|mgnify:CR=1 FL=1
MNMKSYLLVIGIVILLVGCARSNALTGDGSADLELVDEEQVEEAVQDVVDNAQVIEVAKVPVQKQEELVNVTVAPVYAEFRNTCSEDIKGVVRAFDDAGNKKVYRNTCLGGILTDYMCVNSTLDSQNSRCQKGCTTTRYGAICKE